MALGLSRNRSALDTWWLCGVPLLTSGGWTLNTGWKQKSFPGATSQPVLGKNRTWKKSEYKTLPLSVFSRCP